MIFKKWKIYIGDCVIYSIVGGGQCVIINPFSSKPPIKKKKN